MSQRPSTQEFGTYHGQYIALVEGTEIISILEEKRDELLGILNSLSEEKWDYRYAPGKWSIKEVVLHLIDTERIFVYRGLRAGRHDSTPMPGFDQVPYVEYSFADRRSVASVLEEYKTVRAASISLYKNMQVENLDGISTASDAPISARAAAFLTAGHEIYHINLLHERYL